MNSRCMIEELHVEVHRITKCPYTPSLKKLHDILQNVDIDLLQLWARGNRCQIADLATIVLEALELWPFTTDVLRIMASVPSFRNAALQQKPVLLESLVANVIDSNIGFDKYAATCIALLSTPLEIAIPAGTPVFLMKCLERAVQSLSTETIRPVYILLSGVESSCLDILPFDILYSLQSQMIHVLSTLDSDDHLASLLCLAVLAKFSSRPQGIAKSQHPMKNATNDETGSELADRFLQARKFFLSRVPKALDLVVIKAIRSCSQSCQLSTNEIVESLKLSKEIVDSFDKKEKSSWLAGNVKKTKKLREKILRSGIETQIQCEALNFLVSLSAEELETSEVITTVQKYFLTTSLGLLSTNAIEQCIVLLQDTSLRELLQSIISEIARDKWHPRRESLTKIDNAIRFVSVFTERIPSSTKLPKAVLQSISSDMVSGMARRSAVQVEDFMRLGVACGHSAMNVCPSSYHEAQERLHQLFSTLVLRSALYAPQCGVHLDVSALELLLEKQSLHPPTQRTSVKCIQRRPMNIVAPKMSIFEASTPGASVSLNWKENLLREMSRDATCRYDGVVRMVGEICRDLEFRCNETERPLRDEQAKTRDLQTRLANSEQDRAELANQARKLQSIFATLETEKGCLANQVEATESRSKELETTLENIRREFDSVKTKAEHAARAACESARQQDLIYLAAITGKDEMLEERSLKLASIENRAKSVELELTRMEAINTEKLSINETQIATLNTTISTSECRIKELQGELTRTKEQNTGHVVKIHDNETLIEELKGNIIALNHSSDQYESLISTLKIQLQEAEIVRLQHETYVSAKDAEFERLAETYQSLEDKKKNELELARRSAAIASEQFETTIAALQSKIGDFRKERKERAREFAEAQELSVRLMSLMGATKRRMPFHAAGSRNLGDDSHNLPQSDADSSAAKPCCSPNSRASSRAPKRMKRRQDPASATTREARSRKSIDISNKYLRSTVRVPLASTQGLGPLTQTDHEQQEHDASKTDGPWTSSLENDRIPQGAGSDEDFFGAGDTFTGTDQRQISALRSPMSRHEYDESTTDF